MKQVLENIFAEIISVDNLLEAWKEFLKGKRNKKDVQEFSFQLMDDILALHYELLQKSYKHGEYISFKVHDPKPREIHKAPVRDRLLHHAIYRKLYPFFNRKFIADSFSCRNKKGTHKALDRLRNFAYKVSKNNTRTCWVLQCDIKKFFASIDQGILLRIIEEKIFNPETLWLVREIIESFNSREREYLPAGRQEIGLPIGNLTSQLFANIYLSRFDNFIKHNLKVKFYARYTDDFVIVSDNVEFLTQLVPKIKKFLLNNLKLELHPDKIIIRKLCQGIDFLGYVILPRYRILRTKTKKRTLKRVNQKNLASYLGLLEHCNGCRLSNKLLRLAYARNGKSYVYKYQTVLDAVSGPKEDLEKAVVLLNK